MIAIQVPDALFERLKRVANLTHRSIEDIAVTSLEAALPLDPNLPADLADELAAMHLYSDDALRSALLPSFTAIEERKLNQINTAAGERELTPNEISQQSLLIFAYRRSVLRRAKALALLVQRGHPIPPVVSSIPSGHGQS